MADAWTLVGFGVVLAFLWPLLPYLKTLHKGWPDWGILSYPLAVGVALVLAKVGPVGAPFFDVGDSYHIGMARLFTLPMAVADPIHGWVGRRKLKRDGQKKSRQGLLWSLPFLFLAQLFAQPLGEVESLDFFSILFIFLFSLPLFLGAWTETWWKNGPDNIPIVIATWIGYSLLYLPLWLPFF